MLFSSLTFLTVFLPIVLIVYFILPSRNLRNWLLMLASLLFYAWGEPKYVFLMFFLVLFDYGMVLVIDRFKQTNPLHSKTLFWITISVNLGLIGYYKYIDLMIVLLNDLFSMSLSPLKVALPIGISFFTFQIMSYVIDVYLGKIKVQKRFDLLLTYVSLFPQLIAGPIVRYQTIEEELIHRKENIKDFNLGFKRFLFGLGKKVIIANNVAMVANFVFNQIPGQDLTFTMAWFGVIAFTLQIYFDFSAYSDMAIGLGHVFGFHFLENFNYPYIAKSITDFWRRWHISLSSWFKDYVYIPLGGNRVSQSRWLFNILVVWFLTGLWHGAAYNFILWGLYFGLILIIEKRFIGKFIERIPILNHIYVLIIVMISWVIFNTHDLAHVSQFITNMMDYKQGFDFTALKYSQYLFIWPYLLFGIIGSTPLFKKILAVIEQFKIGQLLTTLLSILVLALSLMFLVNDSYNPFIYFRF